MDELAQQWLALLGGPGGTGNLYAVNDAIGRAPAPAIIAAWRELGIQANVRRLTQAEVTLHALLDGEVGRRGGTQFVQETEAAQHAVGQPAVPAGRGIAERAGGGPVPAPSPEEALRRETQSARLAEYNAAAALIARVEDSGVRKALQSRLNVADSVATNSLAVNEPVSAVDAAFSTVTGRIVDDARATLKDSEPATFEWTIYYPGTSLPIGKRILEVGTHRIIDEQIDLDLKAVARQQVADEAAANAKTIAAEQAAAEGARRTAFQSAVSKLGLDSAFAIIQRPPANRPDLLDQARRDLTEAIPAVLRQSGITDPLFAADALTAAGLPSELATAIVAQAKLGPTTSPTLPTLPASAPPVSPVSQRLVAGTGAGRIQAGLATEQTSRPPAAAATASFRAQELAAQQTGASRPAAPIGAAIQPGGQQTVEELLKGYAGALTGQVGSGQLTASQASDLFSGLVAGLEQLATTEGVDTLGMPWQDFDPKKLAGMSYDQGMAYINQLKDLLGAAIEQRKQQRIEDRQKELDRLAVEQRGQELRISARSEIQRRDEARASALAQLPIDRQTAERGFLGTLSGLQNLLPPIGAGAKIGGANIYTDLAQRIGAPNPGFAGVGVEHIPTPDFDAMFERAKQEIMAAYPQTTVEQLVQ